LQQRFKVLDSFRGLSAIFVILFHMHYIGSFAELPFFKNSYLFVEFFFTLSGFVLAHGYYFKKNLFFKDFLIKRTFRLFPLHIAVLSAFIIFEFLKLFAYNHGVNFNSEPFTGSRSVDDLLPNLFLLQSWLPNITTLSWNRPSWSISIEYYTYIIFFITLLMQKYYLSLVWLFIALISYTWIYSDIMKGEDIVRGLSCFFSGSLTYIFYQKYKYIFSLNKILFSVLEFGLLLAVVYLLSADFKYQSIYISIVFNIVILIFAFERGHLSFFFKNKIFIYIGKLSYSMYMVHTFVLLLFLSFILLIEKIFKLELLFMVDETRYFNFGSTLYNNTIIMILLLCIIVISRYTYNYIELKGQKVGKDILEKRKPKKIQ
jgi:peptidoglycan/LPS O-acetylase OafA/YrhL